QRRIFGRPEPRSAAELLLLRLQQGAQAAKTGQSLARQVHGAAAGHPGTQEDCQQLGIGQGAGTLTEQLFPGALGRRPIGDGHVVCSLHSLYSQARTTLPRNPGPEYMDPGGPGPAIHGRGVTGSAYVIVSAICRAFWSL